MMIVRNGKSEEGKKVNIDLYKQFVLFDHQYTPKGSYRIFTRKQHDILRDEIIDTVLRHPYTKVFVKPHPRQEIIFLEDRLRKYDNERVMIKEVPALILANYCIPVILGPSTVCYDCLKMGKVAFEYLRDELKDTYQYTYQNLGMVYVVRTPQELIRGVRKLYGFNLETSLEDFCI